jgi:SAM-dependent methyltransferase
MRVQFFGPATERMLDLAKVRVGSRVLDVGAGTGDQTLAAAGRVGPTGSVLATDISASMLEVTAKSARDAGLSQRLDLASESFSTAEKDPFLSIPHAVARRVGALTSPPEPFGEFRLGTSGVMSDGFRKAGFRDVAVHVLATRRRFPSLADAMQYAKGTPLPVRELLVQLNPRQQDEAWTHIERAFQQFVGPDGFDSPCELLIGVGTK